MKIIGVMTEDFSIYYDLVKVLKERKIPFISLSPDDAIPANVGVIFTTNEEQSKIWYEPKLAVTEGDDISLMIDKALKIMEGKERFGKLIIGIDPGKRPGLAVLGDGDVLEVYQVDAPEKVVSIIKRVLRTYPDQEALIRIGDGAPTHRNRIINGLFNLGVPMEMVDESNTTQKTVQPDIKAAIDIALCNGIPIKSKLEVAPTEGEIRDIQRISRLESNGAITISKPLAKKVAAGLITLEEAIKSQQKKKSDGSRSKVRSF
ncbi:hypothetical protein [[Eubacterium] cellulosolvens]